METATMSRDPVEFSEASSEEASELSAEVRYSDVVLHATDWTTETVVSQLKRGNIVLKPRFQRRDAWDKQRKSQFIESLILGLPIPQIVLAESRERRGSFVVLDGKQRLLSLLQFWGFGEGPNNSYKLSGLDVRKGLSGKTYADLEGNAALLDDFTSLLNQPIRTVVIKNWPNIEFLHLVFLRLNTGSVKLSPQELRQALFPGEFTDFVDERSVKSTGLRDLLGLDGPDYRMRDVELLARHLAFHFFLRTYAGRFKSFLDTAFEDLNKTWPAKENAIVAAADAFDAAIVSLVQVFPDGVARKPGSKQLNRAILDALLFFAVDPRIREATNLHVDEVRKAYARLFDDRAFAAAVERDTAGVDNTALRLDAWGSALCEATGLVFAVPKIVDKRITFSGFWE
jgi:hypothetical protein